MIPHSIQALDTCSNCAHVFRKYDYDQGNEYYCNVDQSDRPRCQSVAMEESDHEFKDGKHHELWWEWSKNRRVYSFTICEFHVINHDIEKDIDRS
jgi:hypothetical protein